jgi:hypothetical protein
MGFADRFSCGRMISGPTISPALCRGEGGRVLCNAFPLRGRCRGLPRRMRCDFWRAWTFHLISRLGPAASPAPRESRNNGRFVNRPFCAAVTPFPILFVFRPPYLRGLTLKGGRGPLTAALIKGVSKGGTSQSPFGVLPYTGDTASFPRGKETGSQLFAKLTSGLSLCIF